MGLVLNSKLEVRTNAAETNNDAHLKEERKEYFGCASSNTDQCGFFRLKSPGQ